jgi:hypothetical protein
MNFFVRHWSFYHWGFCHWGFYHWGFYHWSFYHWGFKNSFFNEETILATALTDLGRLAAEIAEVVKLCATNIAAANNFKLLDDGGVHRECALYTDAVRDLANREGFASART